MRLSDRVLNRTLWVRQQLVAGHRSPELAEPVAMAAHLLGLQAQENLSPYLSLSARIDGFDPRTLSATIADRRAVRLLSMRGTVHVLTAADALSLRAWVQPTLDRVSRGSPGSRPARDIASADLHAAVARALADGPLSPAELGARLVPSFPDVPADALRSACRDRAPLVQVPPRGLWRRSGGVVYELVSTWLPDARPIVDLSELVRRYLRAYGPASPADMTAWSGVTRLGPVFAKLREELVEHTDERGRPLFDLVDGVLADADLELPTVCFGNFDNLWLSHADRSRIATAAHRKRWTGPNGGIGASVFVDGMLEGVWNRKGNDITVTPFRPMSKRHRSEVDNEIARIRAFLAIAA